jgi:hypothetical protein
MLSVGLSKTWPEALAAFTGERELDARSCSDGAALRGFPPLGKNHQYTEHQRGQEPPDIPPCRN